MSLFARDLETGMAKWIYQMTPHDHGIMTVLMSRP
jgi:glucose dehydrogenase